MTSEKRRFVRQALGMALGFVCLLSTAGCDYWPPALQACNQVRLFPTDSAQFVETNLEILPRPREIIDLTLKLGFLHI